MKKWMLGLTVAVAVSSQAALVNNGDFSSTAASDGNNLEYQEIDQGWDRKSTWTLDGGVATASAVGHSIQQVNSVSNETGSTLYFAFDWTPAAGATGIQQSVSYQLVGWQLGTNTPAATDKMFIAVNGSSDINADPVGTPVDMLVVDLVTGANSKYKPTPQENIVAGVAGSTTNFSTTIDLSAHGEGFGSITNYDYVGIKFFTTVDTADGGEEIEGSTLDNVYLSTEPQPERPTMIVEWGAAGGATNIVTASAVSTNETTTYVAGAEINPPVGVDYYSDSTGKSPIFNFAGVADGFVPSIEIGDRYDGDRIQVARNKSSHQSMVVWESFLDESATTLDSLAIEITAFGSTFSNGTYRFLIQKVSGEWFASDATALTDSYSDGSAQAADEMIWYAYTPHDNGSPVIASTSSNITMEGVASVGYFFDVNGEEGTIWYGTRTRHFAAYARQSTIGFGAWASINGVTGGKTGDDDGDGLDNWGEYVFDGIPYLPEGATNQGIPPAFDVASGDYSFSLRADSALSYSVMTSDDLVSGSWTTNAPVFITENDGEMDAYSVAVGTTAEQLFIKLLVEE